MSIVEDALFRVLDGLLKFNEALVLTQGSYLHEIRAFFAGHKVEHTRQKQMFSFEAKMSSFRNLNNLVVTLGIVSQTYKFVEVEVFIVQHPEKILRQTSLVALSDLKSIMMVLFLESNHRIFCWVEKETDLATFELENIFWLDRLVFTQKGEIEHFRESPKTPENLAELKIERSIRHTLHPDSDLMMPAASEDDFRHWLRQYSFRFLRQELEERDHLILRSDFGSFEAVVAEISVYSFSFVSFHSNGSSVLFFLSSF